MRPWMVLAAIAVLCALWLGRGEPEPRADIRFVSAEVFTLDPQRMSWQQDLRVARALYEPLLVRDAVTGLPKAGLAQSWSCSEDGRTWTFSLRTQARWSDGSAVTAGDVRYAWMRALLPDLATDFAGIQLRIEGAEDFLRWRADALAAHAASPGDPGALWSRTREAFDRLVAMRAPDEHTLVITLVQPVPYWLDLMTFPTTSPVQERQAELFRRIDPASGAVRWDTAWTKPGALVTNGPYRLESWRYKRGMRMVASATWWNHAAMRNQSLELVPIADPGTAVLAFGTGSVDWLCDVAVDWRSDMAAQRRAWDARVEPVAQRLATDGLEGDDLVAALPAPGAGERRDLVVIPAFGTEFWQFNCRPTLPDGSANPFAIAGVRRAFARCVDRAAIVDRVTRLGEPTTTTLVPRGAIPGYESPSGIGMDRDRARTELANAGWSDRNGDGVPEDARGMPFPSVTLLYSVSVDRYKLIALALRDMWRATLGVDVQLVGKDTKFFKDDLKQGKFMIARGNWYGDYADPLTFLELLETGNGNNDRGYSNPAYDTLLREAASTRDAAQRLAILSRAEALLMDHDVPVLPLCQLSTVYMVDPASLAGVSHQPMLEDEFWRMHRRTDAERDALSTLGREAAR